MKNRDFPPISRYVSETIRSYGHRMECDYANRKPYPGFRMVPFSMTMSDF